MSEIKRYSFVGDLGHSIAVKDENGRYVDYSTALRLMQERDSLAKIVEDVIAAHGEASGIALFGSYYHESIAALASIKEQKA